jgi:hypothetical protein
MIFIAPIFYIALCYFLSYQIMHSLARVSRHYWLLRLILLPGVIVHELSHATACLITGTPVTNISFWNETGGAVVHHKPKLAILTQPFISFAPFPVGIVALSTLSHYLGRVHWGLSLSIIFLMVSIAGTLAPSKPDMIHALEGSLVLFAVGVAVYLSFPNLIMELHPPLIQFNQAMLLVNVLLGLIWISLHSLFHLIRLRN